MTHSMPLFHKFTPDFEKVAAETTLPEDPNMWQDEVLQEVYKQVPYLADFALEAVMETVDGERGYGLGHIEVTNKSESPMTAPQEQQDAAGIRKARIPVIIKDGKLTPFDVLITDDARALPLTESRMRQAMFRPHAFDVTSKTPGDQSMIGQLYPPYRQNYGFGGGGAAMSAGMGGKTASKKVASLEDFLSHLASEHEVQQANAALISSANKVASVTGTKVSVSKVALPELETAVKKEKESCGAKTASILEAVLPTANVSDLQNFKEAIRDDRTKLAYVCNEATYPSLERLHHAAPVSVEKRAAAMFSAIKPSVLQVVKQAAGVYALKTASHRAWAPIVEHIDRGELVRRVGVKVAMDVDTAGAVTVGADEGVSEAGETPAAAGPISAPGMYMVRTTTGEELTGSVIPNLLDVDGKPLPISLFADGQHAACQSDMAGVPAGEYTPPPTVPAEQAQGHGCFYMEYGGIPCATLPLTLNARLSANDEGESPRYAGETFDGRPVQVSVQPYAQQIVNVDGLMIIPQGWTWMPLDQAAEVELAENASEVGKTASLNVKLASVEVVAGGPDSFALRGYAVEKLAADDRQFLNQDQTLFTLVGLGANPGYALRKMAHAIAGGPQRVRIGHTLKLASELRGESYTAAEKYIDAAPVYRHRMWKEAAAIPDPVAVDSVLSLGFINPENLATYVGYLPTLDESQRRLCELLIGARLGMRELSEGAIERAIRALEDVIEGLKVIAFQG